MFVMSSGMRGRAGMILAFRLRRVARFRQRKVLKEIVLPGPDRRRHFASIMPDRILDKPAYPTVPNEATSRMVLVSLFALMTSSPPGQITPPFSVGRRKPGGWAGKKKATTLGNGAASVLVSGTAKQQKKCRCQPMSPRLK
jgi:hypothetical protein